MLRTGTQSNLLPCALLCRLWKVFAEGELYRRPFLRNSRSAEGFCESLRSNPARAALPLDVEIEFPRGSSTREILSRCLRVETVWLPLAAREPQVPLPGTHLPRTNSDAR